MPMSLTTCKKYRKQTECHDQEAKRKTIANKAYKILRILVYLSIFIIYIAAILTALTQGGFVMSILFILNF